MKQKHKKAIIKNWQRESACGFSIVKFHFGSRAKMWTKQVHKINEFISNLFNNCDVQSVKKKK